jgi:hypothetical protein
LAASAEAIPPRWQLATIDRHRTLPVALTECPLRATADRAKGPFKTPIHRLRLGLLGDAGRVMARGQAKRQLAPLQHDIDREMRNVTRTFAGAPIRGFVGNTEHTRNDSRGPAS